MHFQRVRESSVLQNYLANSSIHHILDNITTNIERYGEIKQ